MQLAAIDADTTLASVFAIDAEASSNARVLFCGSESQALGALAAAGASGRVIRLLLEPGMAGCGSAHDCASLVAAIERAARWLTTGIILVARGSLELEAARRIASVAGYGGPVVAAVGLDAAAQSAMAERLAGISGPGYRFRSAVNLVGRTPTFGGATFH